MKNSKTSFFVIAIAILLGIETGCQKDNSATIAVDSEIEFAISNSHLKNSPGYNMSDADKIVLTIQFSDGTPTKYTDSELKIEQMNGNYYTKKITLKTGNYKLIKFIILDANGSTIFTTPLIGSQEAPNVDNPLPINFTVTKDVTTPVSVQVLSSENKSPEDFGLSHFPIVEVKTFGFMIGVADKETGVVLSSKLTVSNGTYSYVQDLDAKLNNVVTVKDDLTNYTLTVEKLGYVNYTHSFTIAEIKAYLNDVGNLPLFAELEKLKVTDIDGNIYKTVAIDSQVWMQENLKVIHYRNSDPISDGTGIGDYSGQTEPKYYFSNNDDINNVATYGRLYTWYAANDNRNVCPTGWHLPSNEELTKLIDFLGGESVAGYKLKETGLTHWSSPNTGATNESMFTGLPGGYSSSYGDFAGPGIGGYFWSSTTHPADNANAWNLLLYYNDNAQIRQPNGNGKKLGLSVRCIKD